MNHPWMVLALKNCFDLLLGMEEVILFKLFVTIVILFSDVPVCGCHTNSAHDYRP